MKKTITKIDTGDVPVSFEINEDGEPIVRYGKQVVSTPTYTAVCHQIGYYIMHALRCQGKLDELADTGF